MNHHPCVKSLSCFKPQLTVRAGQKRLRKLLSVPLRLNNAYAIPTTWDVYVFNVMHALIFLWCYVC